MSMRTSSALPDFAFPAWRGASAPGRPKTPLTAPSVSPDMFFRSFQTQSSTCHPPVPGGKSTQSFSAYRTTGRFKSHKPKAVEAV